MFSMYCSISYCNFVINITQTITTIAATLTIMIILTASNNNNNKHPPLPTHYHYIRVYMCILKIYLQNVWGMYTEQNYNTSQYALPGCTHTHGHSVTYRFLRAVFGWTITVDWFFNRQCYYFYYLRMFPHMQDYS